MDKGVMEHSIPQQMWCVCVCVCVYMYREIIWQKILSCRLIWCISIGTAQIQIASSIICSQISPCSSSHVYSYEIWQFLQMLLAVPYLHIRSLSYVIVDVWINGSIRVLLLLIEELYWSRWSLTNFSDKNISLASNDIYMYIIFLILKSFLKERKNLLHSLNVVTYYIHPCESLNSVWNWMLVCLYKTWLVAIIWKG